MPPKLPKSPCRRSARPSQSEARRDRSGVPRSALASIGGTAGPQPRVRSEGCTGSGPPTAAGRSPSTQRQRRRLPSGRVIVPSSVPDAPCPKITRPGVATNRLDAVSNVGLTLPGWRIRLPSWAADTRWQAGGWRGPGSGLPRQSPARRCWSCPDQSQKPASSPLFPLICPARGRSDACDVKAIARTATPPIPSAQSPEIPAFPPAPEGPRR